MSWSLLPTAGLPKGMPTGWLPIQAEELAARARVAGTGRLGLGNQRKRTGRSARAGGEEDLRGDRDGWDGLVWWGKQGGARAVVVGGMGIPREWRRGRGLDGTDPSF